MKDGRPASKAAPIPARRKFLAGAAGASALALPTASRARVGPITMRWQSTWPANDIFHEYALDYARKVNDMAGGDLRIEVLPSGAVVPDFKLVATPTTISASP